MSRRRAVLGVVLGLVMLGIMVACDESSTEPTPVPLTVTVEDIYQAYQENEARANATYKEIKLNLHFYVDEIEDRYVIQDLAGFLDQAQLRFDQEELIRFNIGDRANRICELDGFDLDTWLRFDCR